MTSAGLLDLSPHIFVSDAGAAARFYEEAFGAVEVFRNGLPDGTLLFVEYAMGGAKLLVSEEVPELAALGPDSLGGSPVLLTLEVADVDDIVQRAISRGAEVELPVSEMFWGERYGIIRDPFGHRWAVGTRRQDLTPQEVAHRTPPDLQS